MDARLDAQLAGAVGDRLAHAPRELCLGVLVGVGRARALAEAAERAADGADVRDVDVAVDDERDGVAREARAQLVGGEPHLLDRLGPRLGEHRRQLLGAQRAPLARALDRAGQQRGADRRGRIGAARAAARDEAPVGDLDRVHHRLGDPFAVDVLRIHAQALGQRDAVSLQALAHLMGRGKGMLGRDVIAVGRQPAEVARARRDQRRPPVGEVRRHLDAHVGHQAAGVRDQRLHVLDPDRPVAPERPVRRRELGALAGCDAGSPVLLRGGVGDRGRLAAVVALMRDEVLQDHLLDVAVALVQLGDRLKRRDPLGLGLADPDEDARGERDPQLAGRGDRLQAQPRMLARRAGVHGRHQALGDRLEHQPLRGGHLAQSREVLAREHAEVGVRQKTALQRALAHPRDIGREVAVPVGAQPARDLGVDLGALAGEHEQLLDVAPRRAVEDLEHLLGAVQVRLVRGERAVLAIAAARARQRQRQVAAERDPAAHVHESMTPMSPADEPRRDAARRARRRRR